MDYSTIFTEPEGKNCFSIIVLLLLNSVVNIYFDAKNHSVLVVPITCIKEKSQFPQ